MTCMSVIQADDDVMERAEAALSVLTRPGANAGKLQRFAAWPEPGRGMRPQAARVTRCRMRHCPCCLTRTTGLQVVGSCGGEACQSA